MGKVIAEKYLVRGILGEGGTAIVLDARHMTIGCPVAIKVLRASLTQHQAAIERFHREARTLARIAHAHVCAVHDLDALPDRRPYLVLERLIGESLAERIASRGPMSCEAALEAVMQTLSALAAAHEQGVIHRDVKPENVFLTRSPARFPHVKLLDFGASKSTVHDADAQDLTGRGMVMGTPHYMSPEQARGERDVDERADVYACGVVLYEALTGRRPFVAPDHRALLRQILHGDPPPARELDRSVQSAFEAVLWRAMARRREDRYSGAMAFRAALESLSARIKSPRGTASATARDPQARAETPAHIDTHPTRFWRRAPPPVSDDDATPTRYILRGPPIPSP